MAKEQSKNYGYKPNYELDKFDPNIYQGVQPSCAIRSQEIILRDYGIIIPQEELIDFAIKNGWYNPGPQIGGTPKDATGNLLNACGITTTRTDNATIYDIIAELRAGHRVIVSIDANELWVKNEPNLLKKIAGEITNRVNDTIDNFFDVEGSNHALIVAGVNVNPKDPTDMKVVFIDSGTGDVCIEYKYKDFQNAWNDSHCRMISTNTPAPYQYDYTTHQMEPSSFKTDYMPSMAALPAYVSNRFWLNDSYYAEYGNFEPVYDQIDHMVDTPEQEYFVSDTKGEDDRATDYGDTTDFDDTLEEFSGYDSLLNDDICGSADDIDGSDSNFYNSDDQNSTDDTNDAFDADSFPTDEANDDY